MNDGQAAWRRREFLAFGSAGLAVSFLIAPRGAGAAAPSAADPRLALAYVAGSDRPDASPAERYAPRRLVRAAALPAGDAAFARHGARLAIEGHLPAAYRPGAGLDSLAIELDWRPFHKLAHHLWRIDARPVLNVSAPVSLALPVDAGAGLVLSVALGADGASSRAALRFGLGREPGLPKLRRGLFILSWPDEIGGPEPELGACRWGLASAEGPDARPRLARLDRRHGAWVPVDFPYVALHLEPAMEPYGEGADAIV